MILIVSCKYGKHKEYYTVNDIYDLEALMNAKSIINDFKSFSNISLDTALIISKFIDETPTIPRKRLGNYIKSLRIYTITTVYDWKYWFAKGYDYDESIKRANSYQTANNLKYLKKYDTKEKRRQISVRCPEYWVRQGLTESDAIRKAAEIIDNNSLNKLISKYGIDEGIARKEKIVEKWLNTMNSKPQDEKDRINKERGKGGQKLKGRKWTPERCVLHSLAKKQYYKTHDQHNTGKTYEESYGLERANQLKKFISEDFQRYEKSARANKGRYISPEIINKQITNRPYFTPWNKGKTRYTDHRIKASISRNGLGKWVPNFNPIGCKIIDRYGEEHGYNFKHALNGGEYHIKELNYWVDGYDYHNNIVIEIDERHHYDTSGNLKPKDVRRQEEIVSLLKCKFIRIKL